MRGRVLQTATKSHVGYIGGEDRYRYKFEIRDCRENRSPPPDAVVAFTPDKKGIWAMDIKVLQIVKEKRDDRHREQNSLADDSRISVNLKKDRNSSKAPTSNDEDSVEKKGVTKKIFGWSTRIALLVVGILIFKNFVSNNGIIGGAWESSSSTYLGRNAASIRTVSAGSRGNVLEFTCSGGSLDANIYWQQEMKNMYPDASVPTATRISARFSSGSTWDMAWTHERGGRISGVPKVQLGASSTIDSAIFSLLGLDGMASRNKEMFNWTAFGLLKKMVSNESTVSDSVVQFASRDAIGRNIYASFDLAGLSQQAANTLKGCVNFK